MSDVGVTDGHERSHVAMCNTHYYISQDDGASSVWSQNETKWLLKGGIGQMYGARCVVGGAFFWLVLVRRGEDFQGMYLPRWQNLPRRVPSLAASTRRSAAVQARPGSRSPNSGTCHGQTETETATVAKPAHAEAVAQLSRRARHAAEPTARTTRVHERVAETHANAGTGPTTTQCKLHSTLLILLRLVLLLGVGGLLPLL